MHVFTVTFNQLNASLLNKQSFIFKNSSCKIIWEMFDFILRSDCTLFLGKSEQLYYRGEACKITRLSFVRRKIGEIGRSQSLFAVKEIILTGSSWACSRYTNRRAAVGTVLFRYELFDWYCNTWPIITKLTASFIKAWSTQTDTERGRETVLLTCCSFSGCVTVGIHSRARWTRPRLTSLRVNHWHTNTVTKAHLSVY